MQHLRPNTTLQGGKYRIERVLGQGGFGITYLAVQTSLQRNVAIKEFFMKDFCSRDEATRTMSTPSTGSSKLVEQYRKKFIKEARNLARLNHPNIISVIDVFEENDTVYYVMPYLNGGSLQDYVKAHGSLSESMAMKYVKQIAGALKYMHEEQHICHYDVKPANILLNDKGNAVLIDFGISKNYDAAGQETTTTPVGMSEGYAPIEQYQQNVEEFSPVSDVYALGATLYFLLHGKRPVSAVHRAGGTALLMSKQLSQGIKDIINSSMKISKRERAKSVDVFMGNVSTSTYRKSTVVQDDDESTILDGSQRTKRTNTTSTQSYTTSPVDNTTVTENNSNSSIGWIIGIAVVVVIGVLLMNKCGLSNNTISEAPVIESDSSAVMEDYNNVTEPISFNTTRMIYTKNENDINVELKVDYPTDGSDYLVNSIRSYINHQIANVFDEKILSSDLDGKSLINSYGTNKYKNLQIEKGSDDLCFEETLDVEKCFENDKCISYSASSSWCHGGVINYFCVGASFKKEDGNIIRVIKDPNNFELKSIIKRALKNKLGYDYDDIPMFAENFENSPMPRELPYLVSGGVKFDYQHYEIGPGAWGQISVVVPYTTIMAHLTDEARNMIE